MSSESTTIDRQAAPDRAAIRAELDETRSAYHELLGSLSDSDWRRKSGNGSWRVGQLMWHLAWGLSFFPKGVKECRAGKATNPPPWIMNPLNMMITRIGSRGATPQSVVETYDKNHTALLACLDSVEDDEWQKGATPLGAFGVRKTVESVFHSVRAHFREHEADVLKGLGRV